MSDDVRTIRDVSMFPTWWMELGLDPDTVLDKDCEECGGRGRRIDWDDMGAGVRCRTCGGTGRVVVSRVMAVHPGLADAIERRYLISYMTDEDRRALRIGRAVLANHPMPVDERDGWLDGWNAARNRFLDAGDDE